MPKENVLIVEDDADIREGVKSFWKVKIIM